MEMKIMKFVILLVKLTTREKYGPQYFSELSSNLNVGKIFIKNKKRHMEIFLVLIIYKVSLPKPTDNGMMQIYIF